MRTFFLTFVCFLICNQEKPAVATKEVFHEEVLLKALPTGDVMAAFSFTTLLPGE
jgi:hypothetical protein